MLCFFTIALPRGFYYEKTELLSQGVSGPVSSYATILFAMYIFSSLLALNQRPVIALFTYFLLRYHRVTVGAPGCEA